jgi:hypothetical protein
MVYPCRSTISKLVHLRQACMHVGPSSFDLSYIDRFTQFFFFLSFFIYLFMKIFTQIIYKVKKNNFLA